MSRMRVRADGRVRTIRAMSASEKIWEMAPMKGKSTKTATTLDIHGSVKHTTEATRSEAKQGGTVPKASASTPEGGALSI